MKMDKKEAISRLKFWIEVLKQEATPNDVEWEEFLDLIKMSALPRI